MANPPPNRIPISLQEDPEMRSFFEQLVNFLTPVQSGEGLFAIVPSNGVFIVGNGVTWVGESGATARTTLSLSATDDVTHNSLTLTVDLTIPNGGTGVSTLTDGGVLLGSGTDPISAMAVLADGEMIVGDGIGDPVPESGATLRTSIDVYSKTEVDDEIVFSRRYSLLVA